MATDADGIVAAISGTLHNADDLRGALGLAGVDAGGAIEPAALVAGCYRRWGIECFARLTGDWAVVILDAHRERVMMARDFVGTCPLYYRLDSNALRWSSNLHALRSPGPIVRRADPAYLAGFLTGRVPRSRTPFIDVRSVPPGHVVVCDKALGAPRMISFWRPTTQPEWRQRTDEECANQLHALLREAVDCRLPSSARARVWIELSGGLDSSTIVATAAAVACRRPVDVTTVTYVFDQSTTADERRYSRAVRDRFGLAATELREGSYSLFFHDATAPATTTATLSAPQEPIPGGGRVSALIQAMRAAGASVLLSGSGGDSVMWNAREPRLDLADLARRFRVRALLERIRRYREHDLCSYRDLLWNNTLAPALSGPGARHHLDAIRHAIDLIAPGDFGSFGDVAVSYPFFDRRIIDFMLSIPFEQKRAPGSTRALHRRAVAGMLPECVTQRVAKVGAAEPLYRAVRREWPRVRALFGEESVLARLGLIDVRRMIAALERVRAGLDAEPFALMRTISLEAWLQCSS